jgi:hypothetical protein
MPNENSKIDLQPIYRLLTLTNEFPKRGRVEFDNTADRTFVINVLQALGAARLEIEALTARWTAGQFPQGPVNFQAHQKQLEVATIQARVDATAPAPTPSNEVSPLLAVVSNMNIREVMPDTADTAATADRKSDTADKLAAAESILSGGAAKRGAKRARASTPAPEAGPTRYDPLATPEPPPATPNTGKA